jgi:hypothetical protein
LTACKTGHARFREKGFKNMQKLHRSALFQTVNNVHENVGFITEE